MRHIVATALAASLLLVGCATPPVPLNTIQYGGVPAVKSQKSAKIAVVTGEDFGSIEPTLVPIGKILLPIGPGNPTPHLNFTPNNQRSLVESLRRELVRNEILKTVVDESSNQATDISIVIIFAETHHDSGSQRYVLDAAMEIRGGKEPFGKQYKVSSDELDTAWERLNTNAYEGKAKAVRVMLLKLVPDIERYLAENQ
jgi:hypothetical protein